VYLGSCEVEGPRTGSGGVVCSCEVEGPPAKAWLSRRFRGVVCSCEVEGPPAKAGCPGGSGELFVAVKLRNNRLKPGGVQEVSEGVVCSCEVEGPPAKAWWCPGGFRGIVCSCEVEGPPAKAWWYPGSSGELFVARKLKYHQALAGGVCLLVGILVH